MRTLTDDERNDIERLMDAYGVDSVLDALAGICGEKAEHIAHSWQDAPLAKRWDRLATTINSTLLTAKGL